MDLQQQYGDDVQFIGVPTPGESVASNAEFIDGTGSDAVTHIQDNDGIIWSTFEVVRRQTYVLIDADGTSQTIEFDELGASIETLTSN